MYDLPQTFPINVSLALRRVGFQARHWLRWPHGADTGSADTRSLADDRGAHKSACFFSQEVTGRFAERTEQFSAYRFGKDWKLSCISM